MRAWMIAASAFLLAACGGGGSAPPGSTRPPTAAALYPSTFEYTSVDPTAPGNYATPALPAHYDAALLATSNQSVANVVTDKGATLGRVLFYDKRLSFNNSKSCASCHVQTHGFADTVQFSSSMAGGKMTSPAMRLANVAFYQGNSMFWNKRAASLEAQATQPIQDATEMGFDSTHGGFSALVTKMQSLGYYPELFAWVFGDSTVTEGRVQNALAQYERAIISSNSKWDRAYAVVYATNGRINSNQNFERALDDINIPADDRFTASEERGRALFMKPPPPHGTGKGCAACHQPPTFSLSADAGSNGLDAAETTIFKSPSLKNVGLADRLMHDGRFGTLAQVLNHYATGIRAGAARDNRLAVGGMAMTAQEQADIVAFLNTLTDSALLTDTRFSDPFKK